MAHVFRSLRQRYILQLQLSSFVLTVHLRVIVMFDLSLRSCATANGDGVSVRDQETFLEAGANTRDVVMKTTSSLGTFPNGLDKNV